MLHRLSIQATSAPIGYVTNPDTGMMTMFIIVCFAIIVGLAASMLGITFLNRVCRVIDGKMSIREFLGFPESKGKQHGTVTYAHVPRGTFSKNKQHDHQFYQDQKDQQLILMMSESSSSSHGNPSHHHHHGASSSSTEHSGSYSGDADSSGSADNDSGNGSES